MPEEYLVPAGNYRVRKRFRNEEHIRHKKDLPWSKRILDLDNNRFFSRTPWAWCRIVLFYLFLYILILILVVFWLIIFFTAIFEEGKPRWLKGQPGLSVVPFNVSTITFSSHLLSEVYPIADRIDKFMEQFEEDAEHVFADCNKDKLWGYHEKKPCVFIKLNKVIGFNAETYTEAIQLPDNRPEDLLHIMKNYPGSGRIWLTCENTKGNNPKFNYIPGPYFDSSNGLEGINRLIGLQFSEMPHNEDVFVTCKIWAKNIEIDEQYPGKGHAKFSFHMRVKPNT